MEHLRQLKPRPRAPGRQMRKYGATCGCSGLLWSCCSSGREKVDFIDVNLLFKLAGIGILIMVFSQVLTQADRRNRPSS